MTRVPMFESFSSIVHCKDLVWGWWRMSNVSILSFVLLGGVTVHTFKAYVVWHLGQETYLERTSLGILDNWYTIGILDKTRHEYTREGWYINFPWNWPYSFKDWFFKFYSRSMQWRNWTLIFLFRNNSSQRLWLLVAVGCCSLQLLTYYVNEHTMSTPNYSREGLLLDFCKLFEQLYGQRNYTINMHLHAHLMECVLDFGLFLASTNPIFITTIVPIKIEDSQVHFFCAYGSDL